MHGTEMTINSIESLYKVIGAESELRNRALLILHLRSWLTTVSDFDPVIGDALHTGIVNFTEAVTHKTEGFVFEGECKDRIYRIATHIKAAIQAITDHTRDKILREHAMLPIYAAREVDSISVQWLSRQPGRTLREKLSGKPYIKAVRRRFSVDTSENRLLKAFILRFEEILSERQSALNSTAEETCDELLVLMQRWLRSEDAAEIGHWGNLPPNNALLQDKQYRKVWDAWLWTQNLDEDIAADNKRINQDILSVIFWNTLSLMNGSKRFRTFQQPVIIDYNNFEIKPALSITGHLFPVNATKLLGKIRNINYDKKFGFLTAKNGNDLFFHNSNLSRGLHIDSLKAGDFVSFEIGNNNQGECADNIHIVTGPESLSFKLSFGRVEVNFGVKARIIEIEPGYVVLTQKPGDIRKKFELNLSAVDDVSKALWSMVFGEAFRPFVTDVNHDSLAQMDLSVIDLCSVRPSFSNNAGFQVRLPFRLLQQHWPLCINGGLVVDCGESKAIAFRPDVETISMRSLFSHTSTLSDATKSSASMVFTKRLKDYIPAKRLSYLVPDWGNDFNLECVRKSINFYFEKSTPLPKSIAAIFAWQSSRKFEQDKVQKNDFVLVVDAFDGGISLTPVQARYQEDLNNVLHESKGISWERHPTFIVENKNINAGLVQNLSQDGCQVSEELIQLFDFDGLVSDAGELSFVSDDNWYHLPGSIREILNQNLDEGALSSQAIRKCLKSIRGDHQGVTVFILPLEDTIKKPELGRYFNWLGSAWSPIKGCLALNEWQQRAGDIALWRDHLPELSIMVVRDGHYENFYLVKDATVTPQRGRAVRIPVKELFTLPAGQMHYRFPLQQGEGKQELQFVAYLKSPAFPLKENTACKLQMTYTYGADDPYELKLIPLDSQKAGFKSIRVEWRSASKGATVDLESLPIPDFPARKHWSDFQKFPKEDGSNDSDLLDWCNSKLAGLDDLLSFDHAQEFQTMLTKRKVGSFEWGTNYRGLDYYCRVNVEGESVFCHSSQFVEAVDVSSLYEGCPVYLDVSMNEKGPSGLNISFYEHLPLRLQEKGRNAINRKFFKTVEFVEKGIFSLRFPALTIWNHGHSLCESDVPDRFRNTIFEGSQKALSIIESENMPDTLKKELFFFLCCLHKDAPEYVAKRLVAMSNDPRRFVECNRNIAFAIGNAELPWQQELLKNVINKIDINPIAMEILSIALWRSEKLISKLSKNLFDKCNRRLPETINLDLRRLSSYIPQDRIDRLVEKGLSEEDAVVREREYQSATLCKHLELLLALLRSRGNEDEAFKMILAPSKELTKKYVTLIDDVSEVVMDNNIELRSRISLQVEKPEMFRKAPDLLYALRMYLTGDSGANTIIITGVSDEG